LGQLTAGVAPEINNLTAVILGNIDILIRELGGDAEPVQTEIDLIIEQVYRIRSIVEKLLQYSRAENGFTSSERIDVNELLDTTLQLVDHELSAKSISINNNMHTIGEVCINPQELQQVLVNLLMNAIQALAEGGAIEYSTQDISDGIEIGVKDYGSGMPTGDLPHVFDPFFSSKPARTGLGLSVSFG